MTIKKFLKSKSFKSIVVLLVIALLCGGLLAILNDVLFISEEEKTQRAIKEIYGSDMQYSVVELSESEKNNSYGEIVAVYAFVDGNYLIKATGINGYQSGTITAWLVVDFGNGEFNGINSVSVASNEKQSLISNFGKDFTQVYCNNDEGVKQGKYFAITEGEDELANVLSGATKSSNAYNNAVNAALYYIRTFMQGGNE
ncbi:MAG TPA: FMN-binding protein [Clostridia bacterium]|nr:FMN-binding protein [Clostridia bacterium]